MAKMYYYFLLDTEIYLIYFYHLFSDTRVALFRLDLFVQDSDVNTQIIAYITFISGANCPTQRIPRSVNLFSLH